MKEIKLRNPEPKHEKTTNRVIGAVDRTKDLFGRTIDRARDLSSDEQASSSSYASDRLQCGLEGVAVEAGYIVVDAGKVAYKAGNSAVRKHHTKGEGSDSESAELKNNDSEQEELKTPLKEKTNTDASSNRPMAKSEKYEGANKARSRTVKESDRNIKLSQRSAKKTAGGAQKSIKTAEQTSKMASKTAKGGAEAAKKTAQGVAKAAEKTAEAAKAAGKALVAAGKAVIAGMKSLVTAIIAGGWISVVIIVIAMLLALFVVVLGEEGLPGEEATATAIASLEAWDITAIE